MPLSSDTQNTFPGPALSVSSKIMVERQVLGPHPWSIESETLKVNLDVLFIASSSRDSDALLKFGWGQWSHFNKPSRRSRSTSTLWTSDDSEVMVYPLFTTQLPPTSKLFPMSLLFRESLITFLTIFLNSTSIKFILIQSTKTAHTNITNDLTLLNLSIFSLCLTWIIHSIWHNWPIFLSEAVPSHGSLLPC